MASEPASTPPEGCCSGPAVHLFLVSWLVLFLELAFIRWFPSHVLFLTFFTNVVLLACFLGMSVGCLLARRKHDFLGWTPLLLGLALAAAHGVDFMRTQLNVGVDLRQTSPQMVFFGTEDRGQNLDGFALPVELVGGFFFLILALAFIGPGQELGRALNRLPNRLQAYTLNIGGSVAGIVSFALVSWLELGPLWWFFPAGLAVGAFLVLRTRQANALQWVMLTAVVFLATFQPKAYAPDGKDWEFLWSPYYRVDYFKPAKFIDVNLIGHQRMRAREEAFPSYALPHLLNRDSGGKPFENVLIIGAGSGNDVSRALQWGAKHVDAVEIDPAILRLGQRDHPDRPYDDPRVTVHLDDGRNFLRSCPDGQYDLIVFALVDSLVLHSSYSNIRLESYLFTEQSFRDVRRCLKRDGQFLTYNYFRQGWIVARLRQMLEETFGAAPLVLTLPYREVIDPEEGRTDEYTMFVSGDTEHLKNKFADTKNVYRLPADQAVNQGTPDGFSTGAVVESAEEPDQSSWHRFGLAEVAAPSEPLRKATDDWPFLYLRQPMIPGLSLRGMAIMGGLALALLFLFRPGADAAANGQGGPSLFGRMFFLGAGFMLVETKAVVQMALLFGSTWMVNSVVFFAVLVMILAANLFVLAFKVRSLGVFYVGLLATLALNGLVPLDSFLGMSRPVQILGSCSLVFAPILFAAVIFAVSFSRSAAPDQSLGANVAGAMLGGLAEYASMLIGFQYLVLVALAFYVLGISFRLPAAPEAVAAA
jgi:spermidine synthase